MREAALLILFLIRVVGALGAASGSSQPQTETGMLVLEAELLILTRVVGAELSTGVLGNDSHSDSELRAGGVWMAGVHQVRRSGVDIGLEIVDGH